MVDPAMQEKLNALFLKACLDGDEPSKRDPAERIKVLLKAGAQPKARNGFDETALHLLVRGIQCCDTCTRQFWRREVAPVLVLMDGLDPLSRDKDGRTARDVAKRMKFVTFANELCALENRFATNKGTGHALRFGVSQRVEAYFEGKFMPGVIIKVWDQRMVYRIRLDTGLHIHAPEDSDQCVRAIPDEKAEEAATLLAGWKSPTPKGDGKCDIYGDSAKEENTLEDEETRHFDQSEEEIDSIIEAISSQWMSRAREKRVELDPQIYSKIQSAASEALNQTRRQNQRGYCKIELSKRSKRERKTNRPKPSKCPGVGVGYQLQ